MINREIFTESPEDDLWRELLQYSFRTNVSRYLKKHSLSEDKRYNKHNYWVFSTGK